MELVIMLLDADKAPMAEEIAIVSEMGWSSEGFQQDFNRDRRVCAVDRRFVVWRSLW